MRRAYSNKQMLVEDGVFYGVSLGYDFCAEHEWGIDGIRRKFGMDSKLMGVESRKMTKGKVILMEDDKLCVLTSREPYCGVENIKSVEDLLPYDLKNMGKSLLETAWCDSDFCVATTDTIFQAMHLRELKEAFDNNNIVIASIGKMLAFKNMSLSLLIYDKLPQDVKDAMYNADKKSFDLYEYEKNIGITKLKEDTRNGYKNEKYFCACSPKWINYEDAEAREIRKKEMKTEHDIMFWINYSDDDDNYGWYTAEERQKNEKETFKVH